MNNQVGAAAPILVAVDGTNLLHRAYHAHAPSDRRAPNGAPTWALWGMARLLAGAVGTVTGVFRRPAGMVVCFDGPRELCRRRGVYPPYKASRSEPAPELARQIAAAPTWLSDAGFSVLTVDGLEADDGCASAAATAAANGWRCVVVTSDRDALALVSSEVRVLRPAGGGRWDPFGPRQVADKYALPNVAGIYSTFAALRGDPSDELPGVAGVGDKTAAKLLCALHDAGRCVDDVLAGDDVAVAAAGERTTRLLAAGAENYTRNRALMAAVTDMDVDLSAAARPVDPGHVAESCAYQGVVDAEAPLCDAAPQLAELVGADF
jgi:DNA polymerase-1